MSTPLNRSVLKAFTMLRAFRSADEWLTSSELSRRANLPEASGYRLIQTLVEIGAVVRGPSGRYRLGLLLVVLSRNVIVPGLVQAACRQIGTDVAHRLGASVFVGVLEQGMVTHVVSAGTSAPFPEATHEGAQFEPYCSALGKVLLADLPPDQLDLVLDGDLVQLTPNTIIDKEALLRQLEQVRRDGFAIDDREFMPDLSCVAVPIRDPAGSVVAAIAASDEADRVGPERRDEFLRELTDAAARISQKICPAGPKPFRTGSALADLVRA